MPESAAAVDTDDLFIPLINFAHFTNPPTPTHRQSTATSILHGFQRAGFIYLSHHPIPPATIRRIFSLSTSFFSRPQSEKDALAWTTPESNRGYSRMGQEKVTNLEDKNQVEELREQAPDLKESFEIGREGQEGMPNRWPAGILETAESGRERPEDVDFERTMREFFLVCKELHAQILRAIAVGLGIEEGWFDEFTVVGDNTLRLLHYPPALGRVFQKNKNQLRAGAHTDYGSITLLFQDERGGLQVQSPTTASGLSDSLFLHALNISHPQENQYSIQLINGVATCRFIDARPIEGTIVVNAADLLARWTNSMIRSTVHRVVEPPASVGTTNGANAPAAARSTNEHGAEAPSTNGASTANGERDAEEEEYHPARYSIAYFCNPDFDKFIDVVPNTVPEGETKKYEGVNSGEYLVKRLAATY
ncbi:MAG: hypothetical protein M1831_006274 [Alyxoria varia]|nr:MAG: hypothetical protein M1831_006274 [Alyxoria varia]